MEEELDVTKLKYVLYARKSTDDPQRQIRSIEDQIAECQNLAFNKALHIVKTIQEKRSAKKPNQRPLFTQMLKDIMAGKYDAIIAWAPDRLARNMREGGELIDMIDEKQIKDMKFVTHYFSRDPNGKMLLGLAFVLSKQYSDKLSVDVTRGIRRNHSEGKSPTAKHGYCRDENGLYRPDGKNFDLMCEGWQMRKKGISLDRISDWMNERGYFRLIKSKGRKVRMDKRMLSDIFKDPFYYGILVQAKHEVDLREIYDFQPMITEEDYVEVQKLSGRPLIPYRKGRTTFLPLKLMVVCSFCKNHMYAGVSRSSSGKRYLFYRCDNKYCNRKKKSIRARVIFEFVYDFLDRGLNLTKKEYDDYYGGITSLSDAKRQQIQISLHSKRALLKDTNKEITERSLNILSFDKSSTIWKENEKRISELEGQKNRLGSDIKSLESKLTDPQQDKLTIEQFLNLSKKASNIIKSGDAIVKDKISRLIFLNFTLDEEKVASYQLKQPFDELLKARSVVSGRG